MNQRVALTLVLLLGFGPVAFAQSLIEQNFNLTQPVVEGIPLMQWDITGKGDTWIDEANGNRRLYANVGTLDTLGGLEIVDYTNGLVVGIAGATSIDVFEGGTSSGSFSASFRYTGGNTFEIAGSSAKDFSGTLQATIWEGIFEENSIYIGDPIAVPLVDGGTGSVLAGGTDGFYFGAQNNDAFVYSKKTGSVLLEKNGITAFAISANERFIGGVVDSNATLWNRLKLPMESDIQIEGGLDGGASPSRVIALGYSRILGTDVALMQYDSATFLQENIDLYYNDNDVAFRPLFSLGTEVDWESVRSWQYDGEFFFTYSVAGGSMLNSSDGIGHFFPETIFDSAGGNGLVLNGSTGLSYYSGFELGDVNQDGAINLLDIAPFIELLSSGTFQTEADLNEDGVVNLLDVGPFVDVLSG